MTQNHHRALPVPQMGQSCGFLWLFQEDRHHLSGPSVRRGPQVALMGRMTSCCLRFLLPHPHPSEVHLCPLGFPGASSGHPRGC